MKRIRAAALLALLLAAAGQASAITYGEPDGKLHPNVGALILHSAGDTIAYCSGTLIAPTIFLTAAHCRLSPRRHRVLVSFDSEITASSAMKAHDGVFYAHPNFPGPQNDTFDIAVVVLDKQRKNLPLAKLPAAGELDDLETGKNAQRFTAVGYGGEEPVAGPGGISHDFLNLRQYSTPSLDSVTDAWLHLSQNPATGDSGTCFGDSGGPNFLAADAGPDDVIAGITITGDAICRATNLILRLDTPTARDFLQRFEGVELP